MPREPALQNAYQPVWLSTGGQFMGRAGARLMAGLWAKQAVLHLITKFLGTGAARPRGPWRARPPPARAGPVVHGSPRPEPRRGHVMFSCACHVRSSMSCSRPAPIALNCYLNVTYHTYCASPLSDLTTAPQNPHTNAKINTKNRRLPRLLRSRLSAQQAMS